MITGLPEREKEAIMSDLFEEAVGEIAKVIDLKDLKGVWSPKGCLYSEEEGHQAVFLENIFYSEEERYQMVLENMSDYQEAENPVIRDYYRQGVDFMTNRPIFRRYKGSSGYNPLTPFEIFSNSLRVPIDEITHVLI